MGASARADDGLTGIPLPVRLPYDWAALIGFLARRAIDGVEAVEADAYTRTLRLGPTHGECTGWVRVCPDLAHACLRVTLSPSLRPVQGGVLAKIAFLFDTGCDPAEIALTLGALAAPAPGVRVPGAVDGFELAVRAILGQQITVRAARTLAGRFAAAFGAGIEAPGLGRVFPPARDIAPLAVRDIAQLGVIAARAGAILEMARALHGGALVLERDAAVAPCIAALTAIRGVGEWTAQYVAMRALGWRDAFPHGDLVLRRALGDVTPRQAREMALGWRPWRAYAAMHLWRSVA